MTESEGRLWLMKLLKPIALAKDIMLIPIESETTARGLWDIHYVSHRISGWIELKQLSRLGDNNKIPWRPLQREWGASIAKFGVKTRLLVFVHSEQIGTPYVFGFRENFRQEYTLDQMYEAALFNFMPAVTAMEMRSFLLEDM